MISLKKLIFPISKITLGGLLFAVAMADTAGAQENGFVDIVENVSLSVRDMPGLVSAAAYLFGLLMGSLGVLDIMKHVENASQVPLRNGFTKLIAGGMGFALPTIYTAVRNSINGGNDPQTNTESLGLLGDVGLSGDVIRDDTISGVFENIIASVGTLPGLVTVATYLLALVIGFNGILKLKEHVERQEQVSIKEPIIRFLTAGALIALPTILAATYNTMSGGNAVDDIVGGVDVLTDGDLGESCEVGESDLGSVICRLTRSSAGAPALLAAASYIFGITLSAWGIFKIKEHVLNPTQTSIWEGVARFIAGGSFLSLPFIVYSVRASVIEDGDLTDTSKVTSYNNQGGGSCDGGGDLGGLDDVLNCFMTDIYGPMNVIITVFGLIAGIILIMIGISRLIKGAQEGAKAPGGLGTILTFITGGVLLSITANVKAISTSLFGEGEATTFAELAYTEGMSAEEVQHANTVIASILMFLVIVGFISVVRGIFILRNVGEGGQQASMMAAVTHLIGGGLAVNLGPLLTAVQTTLGIEGQFGITFG